MKDNKNIPIIVTGIERSGSSIIARILSMCGAFTGNVSTMYENKAVKDLSNRIYHAVNADEFGQYPLPDVSKLPVTDWKFHVMNIMDEQGYRPNNIWMYKSFRALQLWPLWHQAFPEAKWIIVRRRTGDVLKSCEKTSFMKAFKSEEILHKVGCGSETQGWLWWVTEQERIIEHLISMGINHKVIWPDRMVVGDFQQIHEMLQWCDLPWNNSIVPVVSQLLMKAKQEIDESNSSRS